MTINTDGNGISGPYVGNSVTRVFPFDFKVFETSELTVTKVDLSGNQSDLVLGTDYTVSLEPTQGGSVTLPVALPTNYTLTIKSNVPLTQTTEITNQGGFLPEVINDSLDKLTILCQQLRGDVEQSLKIPATDGELSTELPTKSLRANKALIFDASGNVSISTDNYVDQALNSANSASQAAASAAAAAIDAADAENSASLAQQAASILTSVQWSGVVRRSTSVTLDSTYSGKMVVIDTTAGNVTITLPSLAVTTLPYLVGIKKKTSDTNTITVLASGSDTIDAGTPKVINIQDYGICFIADSQGWVSTDFNGNRAGLFTSLAIDELKERTASGGIQISSPINLVTAINQSKGSDVASASTTNIWSTSGNTVHITGTTTITSLGTAPQAGARRTVVFDGALTLDNGANLILPSSANITTSAGDVAEFFAETTTQIRCLYYSKSDGKATYSSLPRSYLSGLTLSNNALDVVNDIDIAVGECRDSTNAYDFRLTSGLTKRLDASWAAGTNAGGLDTSSKANSTFYHIWLVRKDLDGSIDALFSTSATAPVLPSGYTAKRRIGAVVTDGTGTIRPFLQSGDDFYYTSGGVLDVNTNSLGTTALLFTLSTPPGLQTQAKIMVNGGNSSANFWIRISSPLTSDLAPDNTSAQIYSNYAAAASKLSAEIDVLTNTSSQIRARASLTSQSLTVLTFGYVDRRGRDL